MDDARKQSRNRMGRGHIYERGENEKDRYERAGVKDKNMVETS